MLSFVFFLSLNEDLMHTNEVGFSSIKVYINIYDRKLLTMDLFLLLMIRKSREKIIAYSYQTQTFPIKLFINSKQIICIT